MCYFLIAWRETSCLFGLALQGFLVALLPLDFALCACILLAFPMCVLSSRNFFKVFLNQLKNDLNCIEMRKYFFTPVTKRNFNYPMSLLGTQGVSMPSFMLMGPKLWVLKGHIQTDRHTNSPFII